MWKYTDHARMWCDECFLFINLPSRKMQRKREKMLISFVSYSRQIPVLVFLIFATDFSTVSYRSVSYKKTCSLYLICFIEEWPGLARYLLQQPWEKWPLHINGPRGENKCSKAISVVANERCVGNVELDR